MTVENPNVRNTYGGNGSTTVFPFTFALNSEDVNNVEVVLTDTEGREARTTDFALSLNDKSVRYPKNAGAQPLPRGWKITLKRSVPYTQPLNLTSQGPFFAEDIEGQFDRQEMQIQQLAEVAERSVTVGFGADMTPEQFKQNFFDASKSAVAAADEARTKASEAAKSEKNASDSKNSAAASASAADQSARSAGDSKNAAASSATHSAQSATASEASRQASATIESHIKSLLNEVAVTKEHIDWSRGHIDDQKNAVDNSVTQAKVAEQKASNEADKAKKSSAEAEEAARRAENAQRYVGIVRGDNLADKVVEKRHLSFEVYDKSEVYAKSHIDQHFRKIGDKHVDANVDWNTLTEPMTYKIQGATMNDAHHAPPNEYNFGLLVVHRLEKGKDDESRTVQIYYPQATRGYWSRMFNANTWTEWRYIPTYNELETVVKQNLSTRVSKSGDTMTGPIIFANNIGLVLQGTMGDDDGWRVFAGNEGYNNGYLEIATCDDGTEPILFRQYTGDFANVVRTLELLNRDGNSIFPGQVWASAFHGKSDSAGNSDTLGGQSLQWIINQINATKVTGNLAENGWVKFANGLIVQWVNLDLGQADKYITVNFPIKFPNRVLCLIPSRRNRGNTVSEAYGDMPMPYDIKQESFQTHYSRYPLYWLALGI